MGGKRLRSALVVVAAPFAAACLLASPAAAQDASSSSRRLTITGSFGYIASGPAAGIEAMLEAGGFGDVIEGGCRLDGCYLDRDFPITASDPGPASNVRISYSQWPRLEFAFTMGAASPTETEGYSDVLVPDFGRTSKVGSHVRMFAPTVGLRLGSVSVGAGPAYYRLTTWAGGQRDRLDETQSTKTGALIDGGAQFTMAKRLIMDLRVNYRLVGATDVGPLQLESRTLPVTAVDFSHFFFGIGLGFAFP